MFSDLHINSISNIIKPGVIIKFDSLEDLKVYQKSDAHTAYLEATKEQVKGIYSFSFHAKKGIDECKIR